MLCDCDIEEKKVIIVGYFKIAPQRDNRAKVSILLQAEHKVSEIVILVGVSTRSKSAWTMAQVSTDVQAVVEKLL